MKEEIKLRIFMHQVDQSEGFGLTKIASNARTLLIRELYSFYSVIHIILRLYLRDCVRRLSILRGPKNDFTPY